jgi:hypothetical protein
MVPWDGRCKLNDKGPDDRADLPSGISRRQHRSVLGMFGLPAARWARGYCVGACHAAADPLRWEGTSGFPARPHRDAPRRAKGR